MNISSRELKKEAAKYVFQSKPSPIYVSFAYIILSFLFSYLSAKIIYGNFTNTDLERYMEIVQSGDYDTALLFLDRFSPSTGAFLVDTLLSLAMMIVAAGYIIFLLNTIRRTEPRVGNLLDGFGFLFKIIFLNILEAVFIILWSMLFVIPGIIAAYRYRMAIYILCDDPSKSPLQCLRESKALMHGHKWELFRLDLSFLGWFILQLFPLIGSAVRIWTLPYIGMTRALYYDRVFCRESETEFC